MYIILCIDYIDFNRSLNRFLMTCRITEHCSTCENPSSLLLGREIKYRFDLMKPGGVKIPNKYSSIVKK